MSRLEQALLLAKAGWKIFPIQPFTKLPFGGESWIKIATTDEATIRGWFDTRKDMNYGVSPSTSQIIVDLDVGERKGKAGDLKNGIEVFNTLEEAERDFEYPSSETFNVRTPKGGVHIYYDGVPKAYSNGVAKGLCNTKDIDVRGSGGYVVGPGSYTMENADKNTAEGWYEPTTPFSIKTLPNWINKRFETVGTLNVERDPDAKVAVNGKLDTPRRLSLARDLLRGYRAPGVQGEHGDEQTWNTAVKVGDYGVSQDACFTLMYEEKLFPPDAEHREAHTWNDRCKPIWDADGLTTNIAHAYRYRRTPLGSEDQMGWLEGETTQSTDIDGAMDEGESSTMEAQPGTEGMFDRFAKSAYMGSTLFERNINTDMIAPDWIPGTPSYIAVLAKRGVGKTVFLTDLAGRLACDMDWHANINLARDWAVVYVCAEDDVGFQLHLEAWCKEHSKVLPEDRFMTLAMSPDLMSGTDTGALARFVRSKLGNRRIITFLDTWQRVTSRASQNDDKEMQNAIANADGLAKSFNGPVVIAFHPPKHSDDTISGSYIIENASSAILTIKDEGLYRRVAVNRIKGARDGSFMLLEYMKTNLGRKDQFKRDVTGLVAIGRGGSGVALPAASLNRQSILRMKIGQGLQRTMEDRGGAITIKEAGLWLMQKARAEPESVIGEFGRNLNGTDEAIERLRGLFIIGACTKIADDGLAITADDKKIKFVMKGVDGKVKSLGPDTPKDDEPEAPQPIDI